MAAQVALAEAKPPPDVELVERVRARDARAIERLVRTYNGILYRTARAILRDDAEAEDALQETYLRALRSLDGFRGESSLATWLVRIAANEALARLRRRRKEERLIDFDSRGDGAIFGEVADDAARGPERSAHAGEVRRMLVQRIGELPERYRRVFMMRAVQEFSVAETAAALGVPAATVRTRFFRGRALLRGALGEEPGAYDRAAARARFAGRPRLPRAFATEWATCRRPASAGSTTLGSAPSEYTAYAG